MTRQRFPNIRILGAVVLCIAVFTVLIALATLTALAQVTGAGQSKRPAVAVPPDGKVSAQAVERPYCWELVTPRALP